MLKEFLDRFNTRFGVPARHPEAAYHPLGPDVCLGRVLCFLHSRSDLPPRLVPPAMSVPQHLALPPSLYQPSRNRLSGPGRHT